MNFLKEEATVSFRKTGMLVNLTCVLLYVTFMLVMVGVSMYTGKVIAETHLRWVDTLTGYLLWYTGLVQGFYFLKGRMAGSEGFSAVMSKLPEGLQKTIKKAIGDSEK